MNPLYAFNEPEAGNEPLRALNAVHDDCQVYQAFSSAQSSLENEESLTRELMHSFHQARLKAVAEFSEAGQTVPPLDGYTPHASP